MFEEQAGNTEFSLKHCTNQVLCYIHGRSGESRVLGHLNYTERFDASLEIQDLVSLYIYYIYVYNKCSLSITKNYSVLLVDFIMVLIFLNI